MSEPNPTPPFVREERYIVIKRKHLTPVVEGVIREQLAALEIATVECAVIEADWPEYETVWQMIEHRVTGVAGSAIIQECCRRGIYDPAPDREAAGAKPEGNPLNGQWNCRNGHLADERVLRIVEANTRTDWTPDALDALHGFARNAGPHHCQRALDLRDEVPF